MAEVKNIATRESYGNALKELAAEGADKLVVLDADLSAATKTGIFKKEFIENKEFILEFDKYSSNKRLEKLLLYEILKTKK